MTSDELLARVRLMTQLDSNDEDFNDTQLRVEASNCLWEHFSQPIVTTRSGYWLIQQTITTTSGKSFYRIPPRAVVQGLELFCMQPTAGTEGWYQLTVLTSSQAVPYLQAQGTGTPSAFSFESDGIVLYPTPAQSFSLQFRFYLRPAALASVPAYSGVISSAVSASQLIVTCTDPNVTPWSAGSLVDIRNTNGTCEAVAIDVPVASVTDGTNIATINLSTPLTADQFSRLRADGTMAVMSADTSWVIPLPFEMLSALAAYTAAVVLVNKGDAEKAAQLVSRCEANIKAAVDLATPRIKTKPFNFISSSSYLRRNVGRGWF
jgi:hypothetical protein